MVNGWTADGGISPQCSCEWAVRTARILATYVCVCVCVYVCDCVCHLSFSRFCVRVCGRLCACYRAFYTCVRLSNLACVALLLLWSLSCCLARLYVSLGSTSSVSSRLPSTLFSALFQTIRRIPFIVHILFPLHSTLHPFACTRTHTHTHKHTHARFPPLHASFTCCG